MDFYSCSINYFSNFRIVWNFRCQKNKISLFLMKFSQILFRINAWNIFLDYQKFSIQILSINHAFHLCDDNQHIERTPIIQGIFQNLWFSKCVSFSISACLISPGINYSMIPARIQIENTYNTCTITLFIYFRRNCASFPRNFSTAQLEYTRSCLQYEAPLAFLEFPLFGNSRPMEVSLLRWIVHNILPHFLHY